jgi:hypothetical protein
MAKYQVTTLVSFTGEVEAENREEAEQKGWEWEDELMYDGVFEITIEELEEEEEV